MTQEEFRAFVLTRFDQWQGQQNDGLLSRLFNLEAWVEEEVLREQNFLKNED